MIEIRNLQFQPLTFNLSGQGTIHLGPRERKSIARKDLSAEIQTAGKRGLVRITDLATGATPEPEVPATPDNAGANKANTTRKRRK